MKIARVEIRAHDVPLTRPYAIAGSPIATSARMVSLRLLAENGAEGLGAATPEESITGEDFDACMAALETTRWLEGRDALDVHVLTHALEQRLPKAPAARAAADMALHDLWSRLMGAPLVDLLGRAHRELPTSITVGLSSVDETLAEAREHVERGFLVLKVKVGASLDLDVERLTELRRAFGPGIALRADANCGYALHEIAPFFERTAALDVEFLEQPVARETLDGLRRLPIHVRTRLAADESLLDETDARRLLRDPRPFAIWNVKLMKCGGVAPALRLAALARDEGISLMWGCMDESAVGIAAALHAACASSATRYLDLDGSFDLSRDFARDGFVLERGRMRTLETPGLGATFV